MNCPKCGKTYTLKDNYCNRCGLELFKNKKIEKKQAKDIKSSDIFYYYGSVFYNNEMTDWVKNSIVDLLKSEIGWEDLYGGLTEEGKFRFTIIKIGYLFRLTEDLIVKENFDYSLIKTKEVDEFKTKSDWLIYYMKGMTDGSLSNEDGYDSIIKYSSFIGEDIINKAVEDISGGIIRPMAEDFYGKNKLDSDIITILQFDFHLGYWAKFFEDVYDFLNEQK